MFVCNIIFFHTKLRSKFRSKMQWIKSSPDIGCLFIVMGILSFVPTVPKRFFQSTFLSLTKANFWIISIYGYKSSNSEKFDNTQSKSSVAFILKVLRGNLKYALIRSKSFTSGVVSLMPETICWMKSVWLFMNIPKFLLSKFFIVSSYELSLTEFRPFPFPFH